MIDPIDFIDLIDFIDFIAFGSMGLWRVYGGSILIDRGNRLQECFIAIGSMESIKSMGLFRMNNLEKNRQIRSMDRVYLESMRVYEEIKTIWHLGTPKNSATLFRVRL